MLQFCSVLFCMDGKTDPCKWSFFQRLEKKDVTGVYFAVKTFLKESQIAKVVKPVIISILLSCLLTGLHAQLPEQPDTVTILSGRLSLKGLLWHPVGSVVFPAVIFSISPLLHFIPQVCQLMNNAVSFGLLFSFLYSVKLYFMKHVVRGGILAFVVICLYAFITVVASAL